MAGERKVWYGSNPTCQICGDDKIECFVDGRMAHRSAWAIMCLECHEAFGVGLGTGVGQMYQRQGTEFVKIGG